MKNRVANSLGFWASIFVFVFSIVFLAGAAAGLPKPWDVYIPIGASLLLALTFVVMMVSIHNVTQDDKKAWSNNGVVFATIYATLVSIVYVTWIFVVEPHVLQGNEDTVALLILKPGTFMQMVDGLGYTLSMIAALFTAPVFSGHGLERWIRGFAIANGVFAIPVLFSYYFNNVLLGVWWAITIPVYAILIAFYFRRMRKEE